MCVVVHFAVMSMYKLCLCYIYCSCVMSYLVKPESCALIKHVLRYYKFTSPCLYIICCNCPCVFFSFLLLFAALCLICWFYMYLWLLIYFSIFPYSFLLVYFPVLFFLSYIFTYFSYIFVLIICYLDLSQTFYCHGISIFYLDLSTLVCLGSYCIMCNSIVMLIIWVFRQWH